MKIGIISDIHGNAEALTAVLNKAKEIQIDCFLCSGDFVGYYYEPQIVLDLLSNWKLESVRGNHEDMLFECIDEPTKFNSYKEKYGSGLSRAVTLLSKKQLDYLRYLPRFIELEIDSKKIMLCHGSPWDTNQYIYPDADEAILKKCKEFSFDYIILGHTHRQMQIKNGKSIIINPGSVGQPRGTYRGVSHWAMLDTEKNLFMHLTEKYDVSRVISQVKERDPHNDYLQKILMAN